MAVKLLPADDLQSILLRTAPLWEEARGQRIFLTGGTGFFGLWLVESFCEINRALQLDARMVVLTRSPSAFRAKCPHLVANSTISLLAGDVRTFSFPEGKFAYIIHAATDTRATAVANAPIETFSTIVHGTEHVLEFAANAGTEKLLLTSSGAVYGKQPADLTHVAESYEGGPDPLDPASVYAEGKRAAELLCALHNRPNEFECKIARCWAFCGPHLPLDQHFAIGNFIRDALIGRPIFIKGDGTPRRSYLYAADLTVWLWTILFRAPALVPFNVGSAVDVSILELARLVASLINPQAQIHVATQPISGAKPARYVPSIERAGRELGLSESVDLNQTIQKTAAWHLK